MAKVIINLPDVPGRVCLQVEHYVFNESIDSLFHNRTYFDSFDVVPDDLISLTFSNND